MVNSPSTPTSSTSMRADSSVDGSSSVVAASPHPPRVRPPAEIRAGLALSRPVKEMRADLAIAAEEGFEPYSARAWWAVERLSRDVEPLLDRVEQSERVAAELREENEQLRRRIETHDEMRLAAHAATERDETRAECEALRQRIAAATGLDALFDILLDAQYGGMRVGADEREAVAQLAEAVQPLIRAALAGPEVDRG